MNTLLVYDSRYGNTETIAQAIAEELRKAGPVVLSMAADRAMLRGSQFHLIVVGGPTQIHGLSPALKALLEATAPGILDGVAAATFDTRYHRSRFMTGSAAASAAKYLRRAGAEMIVPPESFFVRRAEGPLEHGEEARAREWAASIRAKVEARVREPVLV